MRPAWPARLRLRSKAETDRTRICPSPQDVTGAIVFGSDQGLVASSTTNCCLYRNRNPGTARNENNLGRPGMNLCPSGSFRSAVSTSVIDAEPQAGWNFRSPGTQRAKGQHGQIFGKAEI
jgi:hypothetical protein